ncbi:MAG: pseudaminic acid cytidylyltransferase [Gammaproteobacteria bacterium]|nr:pseudaminic acid cytidylyltransferase [Gammaproteobacteria bacterium]
MMKLAIITARGGSKRIPRKNIKDFCGEPIISYSIRAAIDSNCFDKVMVSTDDQEIAKIAQKLGADVPFMRSEKTSNDFATTAEVLFEVLTEYKKQDANPHFICGIYPTAPFITASILSESMKIILDNPVIDSVFPVTRFSYPIQRALRSKDGIVSMFNPEHLLTRSQDLEPAYHDAGQFYWLRASSFLKNPSLIPTQTFGYLLPEWLVQDIDNLDDWILAEMKYQLLQKKGLVDVIST